MQGDIEYYKGHLRHLQTLNDCLRKDLDDLRRQNSTLKWKKCDLEREIVRLNSTAECLRQRVCINYTHTHTHTHTCTWTAPSESMDRLPLSSLISE